MAITAQNASEYFKSTTFSDWWAEYSSEQKAAALEMAKRELGRALGRPLKEDEPPYHAGDRTREEFAAYEQALYTLMRDAQPKGGGALVSALNQDDQKQPARTLGGSNDHFSPRALAWFGQLSVAIRMGS